MQRETAGEARDMQDGDVRFSAIEGEAVTTRRLTSATWPWRNIIVELKD